MDVLRALILLNAQTYLKQQLQSLRLGKLIRLPANFLTINFLNTLYHV